MVSASRSLARFELQQRLEQQEFIRRVMKWYCSTYLLKEPRHTSSLPGAIWVQEIMAGNSHRLRNMIRMDLQVFQSLVQELQLEGGLIPTATVSAEEQVVLFLYFAGHVPSSRQMQERFQHSGETITR
jgi:hypothetical protein